MQGVSVTSTLPDELTLSQIWNAQWLVEPLTLTDGRSLRVVYRGVWTHGLGPDFSNAFLEIDGRLMSGAIEIHTSSSEWNSHGHDRDPAYDAVVLHVVWQDDLKLPVRRGDGSTVPVLLLSSCVAGELAEFDENRLIRPLGAIGFEFCAPVSSGSTPDSVVAIWERSGDERIRRKTDAVAARLALEPPAQTLYALLLDALGFSRNRDGMRQVSERLPFDHLDARLLGIPRPRRFERAAGLLLGVAGFLPLSPREQEIAGFDTSERDAVEGAWSQLGSAWHSIEVSPTTWHLARVRPAAHPIRRLLALAVPLARLEQGLIEDACERLADPDAYGVLRRWLTGDNPYLGAAHTHEIIVNVLVPFGLAYGDNTGATDLVDRAMELWSRMPAGRGNAVIGRMVDQICGGRPIPVRSARAEQGLLHLHQTGCTAMRCFECPIAQLEVMSTESSAGDRSA